jgi:hypothetical protein
MKPLSWALSIACVALIGGEAPARVPDLPRGAQTQWVVKQPEELVLYLAFDPVTVADRLPPTLRFITLKELAAGGVGWARDHLAAHPAQEQWGVSFFEIVRMGTFTIDGRAPDWPRHGAAALWLARVAPVDSTTELGPGRPLLTLDFWMPDNSYVSYMRGKGHHATFGDVRLHRDSQGKWRGSVAAAGLSVATECTPSGPVTGGASSAGMQVLLPPRSSTVTNVVRVAFAGHREQECTKESSWVIRGSHPLASNVVLGPATFQYGYCLEGGAYPR